MKLVHAADLHLDSPLTGLSRYEGAPVEEIRGATRRALSNLVDLCVEEEAAALLLVGDLFDGNWRDYSTGLFFAAQMSRLRQAGVRVVMVRGNHDAASHISRSLSLPDNVRELSTRAAETVIFEELGLAFHGQGFPNRKVPDDLAARYPKALPDLLNVGLLHTSADGRPGHDTYAPCNLETLLDKGYDYWALGHVHAREVLHEDPWVVFPGNLQGRHARESEPKGATLVTADDGRISSVVHHALDVVRWRVLSVDAAAAQDMEEVLERAREALEDAALEADGRLLACRLQVEGRTGAHGELVASQDLLTQELRAVANDVEGGRVWIEKVKLATRAQMDLSELRGRDDAIGQLLASVSDLRGDEAALTELLAPLEELRRRLPPELRDGEGGVPLSDVGFVREALEDVAPLLLSRLRVDAGGGGA
ncbi:MAG: metallophosphoesterase [Myxococcales bacterium]|nr:metallophosphoesterase [Myxococcales bacterium]